MVAVYNPTTSTYNYNPSSTVAYTVGDPDFYVLSQMIYTSSTKHSFSCFVQYEFSCPAGDSSCAISSDVLELGVTNSTLADLTERIQLKVKQTGNLAMAFNQKSLETRAYLFSTDISGSGPLYSGLQGYSRLLKWTFMFNITPKCLPDLVTPIEKQNDSSATIGSKLPASAIVQVEAQAEKLVNLMDLDNEWDRTHCLPLFDGFALRSQEFIGSPFTVFDVFEFTSPANAYSNPKVKLKAQFNALVQNPAQKCYLQRAQNVSGPKSSCDFRLQVYPSIAGVVFKNYTEFTFTVWNECYAIDNKQPPSSYDIWTFGGSTTFDSQYVYEIQEPPITVALRMPKLFPKLPSEIKNGGLNAFDECGPESSWQYTVYNITDVAQQINGVTFTNLEIKSSNPAHSGTEIETDFKKLYTFNICANFTLFTPPQGPICYNITKNSAQPSLQFYMRDRCFGMAFNDPQVHYNLTDPITLKKDKTKENISISVIKYYKKSTDFFQIDRPQIIISTGGIRNQHFLDLCGIFNYTSQESNLIKMISANISNPENTSEKLEFKFNPDEDPELKQFEYNVTFCSQRSKAYPCLILSPTISVLPCLVSSVSSAQKTRPNIELQVGGQKQQISFDEFVYEPAVCNYTWTYKVTTLPLESETANIDLDALIKQNPALEGNDKFKLSSLNNRNVTLSTNDAELSGKSFATFVTGTLAVSEAQNSQMKHSFELVRFKVVPQPIIPVRNSAPSIVNFQEEFQVFADDNKQLVVGQLFDEETQDLIILTSAIIKCAVTQDWITLPETNEKIKDVIIKVLVPSDVQDNTCVVSFEARDNDPAQSKTVNFSVKIKVEAKKFEAIVSNWPAHIVQDINSPAITKTESDRGGRVLFKFNKNLNIPQSFFNMTSQNQGKEVFNVTLLANPENYKDFEIENEDIPLTRRNLKVSPYDFQWMMKQTSTKNDISMQFTFAQPQLISKNKPDFLRIEMLQPFHVTDASDLTHSILFEPQVIRLQKQLSSQAEVKAIEQLQATMQITLTATFGGNLVLTVFTSIVIGYFWGMINGLQVIALVVLFKIDIPTIVYTIFIVLLQLSGFDLLHTEKILDKIFNFSQTEAFNSNFEEASLDNSNFIISIGVMNFLIVYYALFLAVRCCIHRDGDSDDCWDYVVPWFESHNIEVTTIRFVLEGNIDILLSASISLIYARKQGSLGAKFSDKFSNIFAIILLAALLYAPIHTLLRAIQLNKLHIKQKENEDSLSEQEKQQIEHLEELFEEFKPDLASLLYFLIFIIRRMIMILTLVLLSNHGNFQLAIYLISAFFMLQYIVQVKPYRNNQLNNQEIVNEVTILITGYFLMIFSPWISDVDVKIKAGYTLLVFVLLNIVINLFLVLRVMVLNGLSWLRNRKKQQLMLTLIELRARKEQREREQASIALAIELQNQEDVQEQEEIMNEIQLSRQVESQDDFQLDNSTRLLLNVTKVQAATINIDQHQSSDSQESSQQESESCQESEDSEGSEESYVSEDESNSEESYDSEDESNSEESYDSEDDGNPGDPRVQAIGIVAEDELEQTKKADDNRPKSHQIELSLITRPVQPAIMPNSSQATATTAKQLVDTKEETKGSQRHAKLTKPLTAEQLRIVEEWWSRDTKKETKQQLPFEKAPATNIDPHQYFKPFKQLNQQQATQRRFADDLSQPKPSSSRLSPSPRPAQYTATQVQYSEYGQPVQRPTVQFNDFFTAYNKDQKK